jgi:hypothetical protein
MSEIRQMTAEMGVNPPTSTRSHWIQTQSLLETGGSNVKIRQQSLDFRGHPVDDNGSSIRWMTPDDGGDIHSRSYCVHR